MFPTDYDSILERIDAIDPVAYGRTRNFIDGAVTRLSPYISRGVISTRQVLERTLERGYDPSKITKFIQELAWRDYFQQVWLVKGGLIDRDLKSRQVGVTNREVPMAITDAATGIEGVDAGIRELHEIGYMHNHVRMYTASVACNIGRSHWLAPAKWMYFHLLDADWASNALSWQWVAGTNSGRKYYANQENINRFCYTDQKGTFLDVDYAEFDDLAVPEALAETALPVLETELPETVAPRLDSGKPTLVYTLYNLDPEWRKETDANRVLLFEPSHFEKYPVCRRTIDFAIAHGKNLPGLQVFAAEFSDLEREVGGGEIVFEEHPFSAHFEGTRDERDWMFGVRGFFPKFYAFWKRCEKEFARQPELF